MRSVSGTVFEGGIRVITRRTAGCVLRNQAGRYV